jgi:hypothetical protein
MCNMSSPRPHSASARSASLASMLGPGVGMGVGSEYKRTLNPQLLDLAELESTAAGYRSFQWLYVPGLLQTQEYTTALFRKSNTGASGDLQDRYGEFRLNRQRVLTRDPAPSVHVIIHEGVFHMGFIDREIMAGQLEHLIEASRSPSITIQILPFSASAHPASPSAFTTLDASAPELRTAYAEQPITSVFLGDHDQVEQYASHFARLSDVALRPMDSNGPHGEGTFGRTGAVPAVYIEGGQACATLNGRSPASAVTFTKSA